jgi:LmbE family N-acetylglucosaminyl deacetylase
MVIPGPILGVWAHPDDETYLMAGIMADAVRRGERVACVTATRGELGSFDEERWPTATLGAVREREMDRCLEILGVKEHHWLDYPDGGVADVPTDEGLAKILDVFQRVRPRSVFTFGPDGMTGHPDHKTVSAWTGTAFERAAPPGARLYHATQTPEWAAEFVPVMNRFNVFMELGTPPETPRDELGVLFQLPDDVLELKLRAIEAHTSQIEGMMAAFGQDFFRLAMREEYFTLAGAR